MRFFLSAFFLSLLASVAQGATTPPEGRGCGSELSADDLAAAEADFAPFFAAEQAAAKAGNVTAAAEAAAAAKTVSIPVYFHIVRKDHTTAGGSVP